MRYVSLFSGIEAAGVWESLGWEPVAFAEIEKAPSAILAHRYPDVPNLGDITQVDWSEYAGVDVLVGGSPCQSFSVAGLRKGLADPRGNLALEYLRAVDAVRPRWVVWENVPGVLSADGGRAFGTFLGGLAQLGYGFCYRVLDAQYVRVESHPRAVPQRRRRVFVVGHSGDMGGRTDAEAVRNAEATWRLPAAVLLESESLRGHPSPRREAGERTAGIVAGSLGSRGVRSHTELDGHGAYIPEVTTYDARQHHNPQPSATAQITTKNCAFVRGDTPLVQEVAHSLTRRMDSSEDGTGRGVPLVMAPAFSKRPGQQIATRDDGSCFALTTGEPPRVAATGYAVRRLTPLECERLQGFPDGWTDVPYRNKPMSDGPRYKAIGNSMARNVMYFIGARIQAVEDSLE